MFGNGPHSEDYNKDKATSFLVMSVLFWLVEGKGVPNHYYVALSVDGEKCCWRPCHNQHSRTISTLG